MGLVRETGGAVREVTVGDRVVVSTGRHHGFESMDEQRLLFVLDFVWRGALSFLWRA